MWSTILLLCVFVWCQVPSDRRGCFEGTVTIRNPLISAGDPDYPIDSHRGYIWYVTPPVGTTFDTAAANSTEEFVDEAVMRLEIYFGNPVAYTEVMIRRLHNLIEGPTDTSFTNGFLKFGEKYSAGCCQHSTVDKNLTENYIESSAEDSIFYIPRSDGWTEVTLDTIVQHQALGGSYCSPADTDVLLEAIFAPGGNKADWEQVNNDCPLKCKVQANFVFVLDGSNSIDGTEWSSLVSVLKVFVENVQISSDATHVGYVVYTGNFNFNEPDLFCVVNPTDPAVSSYNVYYTSSNQPQFNNQLFKNSWSSAIIDDSWFNTYDWTVWNTPGTPSYDYGDIFLRSTCFNASYNTNRGGIAWLALYLSDVESLVSTFVGSELPYRVFRGNTATGTGIALGLELFDRPAVERPAVPEKMVVITDGVSNCGPTPNQATCDANPYNPSNLRGIANLARQSGIEIFAVGIGNGIGVTELNYVGTGCRSDKTECFPGYTWGDGNYTRNVVGEDDPHVFVTPGFTLATLQPFLNQLLDVECADASAAGTLCSSDCGDNFCTTCGTCVQCTVHNECPQYPCQYCTTGLTCQLTSTTRVCSEFIEEKPTACESYTCSRDRVPAENLDDPICTNKSISSNGISYEDNCRDRDIREACALDLDTVKVENSRSVCKRQDKSFVLDDFNGNVVCTCQSESDHDTDSAALIAGTTAGGAFLLCIGCLVPCLLLLCLLAIIIIIVLLVLLVLIIIFLLVLLFGIRLAIPPKIQGIAVDNPSHVTAQDNPLSRESGWKDAPNLE